MLLVSHIEALCMTSISILLHRQTTFWRILLLVIIILLKNKELKMEEDITGLLEVAAMQGYLMEGY